MTGRRPQLEKMATGVATQSGIRRTITHNTIDELIIMVTIDQIVDPSTVQLGFSEPLRDYPIGHASPAWCDWDGGQIGGRPSWLNPHHIPNAPLNCENCATDLRFICQLYAPADHVAPMAFHRSFYVFACPACPAQGSPEGSVRVLRTQLEEENDYFPPTEDFPTEGWINHLPSTHNVEICQVCGQRGKGKCPLQGVSFCTRNHQKEYKKYVFQKGKGDTFLPSVYSTSELVVDEEPEPNDGKEEEREALMPSDENDPDLDLEQDDLDDAAGKKHKTSQDPVTTDFCTRVKRAQDQCLRYYPQWGEEVLWILSNPIPATIPACQYCGADRKCEFQIMPQMLYHLLDDHRKLLAKKPVVSPSTKHALSVAAEICETAPPENIPPALKDCHDHALVNIQKHLLESHEMDWGVIAVYTCTASCGNGETDAALGAYREEYAWRQPPP